MEPTYHLEGVIRSKEEMEDFEGPLNLILMHLPKNKIEIRDIQISEILEQYLAYLAEMEAMDLEVASEFVQMAAHLLYIKTKMLLSSQEEISELELLLTSLEQLKAKDAYAGIKEIAPLLGEASKRGSLLHAKPPEPLPSVGEYCYSHEGYELLRALSNVFLRSRLGPEAEEEEPERRRRIVPRRIVYNVRDKSREILERFRAAERLHLGRLYAESQSRSEVVAVFISVLELCRMGELELSFEGEEILLSFAGESVDAAIEAVS